MRERAFDKVITFLHRTFLFFSITLALTCHVLVTSLPTLPTGRQAAGRLSRRARRKTIY